MCIYVYVYLCIFFNIYMYIPVRNISYSYVHAKITITTRILQGLVKTLSRSKNLEKTESDQE